MNRSQKDILRILRRKLGGKCGEWCPMNIGTDIWGSSTDILWLFRNGHQSSLSPWQCRDCQKYFGGVFNCRITSVVFPNIGVACPCHHEDIDKAALMTLLDEYVV